MQLEDLTQEELINIIHRQADDIAALQLEIAWLQQDKQLEQLPVKEQLKRQPVSIDGELYYFTIPQWRERNKTVKAIEVMHNEDYLRKKIAEPYQTLLKKIHS